MGKQLLLVLASFLLMMHLPALIKTPEGPPYLVVRDNLRFDLTTYTGPYHELLKRMSAGATSKKEETVTVFARQDSHGNMYFSDTPEVSFHENQTYEVHTKNTGRLAFPPSWVWGTMLSTWVLLYIIIATILWACRYPFNRERSALTPSETRSKKVNSKASKKEEVSFHQYLSPYQILGIKEGASTEQVKAAYRKQMADYHPDRVAHLGKELQEVAKKKATDINRAYEAILSK